MLGQQEPNTDLIARDFVGQALADLALQTLGIGWQRALLFAGALSLDKLERISGIKRVEFFFVGRNRR
jgi:hypothetical protein